MIFFKGVATDPTRHAFNIHILQPNAFETGGDLMNARNPT